MLLATYSIVWDMYKSAQRETQRWRLHSSGGACHNSNYAAHNANARAWLATAAAAMPARATRPGTR